MRLNNEYLISEKIVLDFLHIGQLLRKSILVKKMSKESLYIYTLYEFYKVYFTSVQSVFFSPSLLVLPSALLGEAGVSHWTQTEACPPYRTDVCCVHRSSFLSVSPNMEPRERRSASKSHTHQNFPFAIERECSQLDNCKWFVTLCSSWFFSSSWASICRSRSSKFPWRSSA